VPCAGTRAQERVPEERAALVDDRPGRLNVAQCFEGNEVVRRAQVVIREAVRSLGS
jgi:hypothetical protein